MRKDFHWQVSKRLLGTLDQLPGVGFRERHSEVFAR